MFTALIVLALAKYYGWSTKPVTPSFTDPADNYAPILAGYAESATADIYKKVAWPGHEATPIFAPAESRPDRSFWHIALSCLATLLAVAWISARQNTPWLEDMTCPLLKGWSLLKRRIFIMCLAIVRPEEMILNAFRQWRDAVMIKETFNKARPRSSPQWTMEHSYFLLMGGFIVNYIKGELPHSLDAYEVEKNGIVVQECVLFPTTLHSLLQKQLIAFPATTAKEINDRSNGSIGTTFLTAFALMRITWFFTYLPLCALQHLTIKPLEFATTAVVGLNVILYLIWRSKPFDVRQPIVLSTKEVELKLAQMAVGPNEETMKL